MDDNTRSLLPDPAQGTARRPLIGLSLLIVEDSHACSEALRLMCISGGARVRRADSVHAAHRHLATYRPSIALVDLGLPDGSGLEIIAELAALGDTAPVVLALSGDSSEVVGRRAASAGAAGFIAKPVRDRLTLFRALLAGFPERQRLLKANVVPLPQRDSRDPAALAEDGRRIHAVLTEAMATRDTARLGYCAQLVASLARDLESPVLSDLADELAAVRFGAAGSGARLLRLREDITSDIDRRAGVMA